MNTRINVRLSENEEKKLDEILAALSKKTKTKLTRSDVIRYLINKEK